MAGLGRILYGTLPAALFKWNLLRPLLNSIALPTLLGLHLYHYHTQTNENIVHLDPIFY